MKTFFHLIAALFITSGLFAQQGSKATQINEFLSGILSVDATTINQNQPIADVSSIAKAAAAKTIKLAKENIEASLVEAKEYDNAIIIVGSHTIVKITDLDNCSPSASWATCMPMGEGYVQKGGALNHYEDYINNIIGVPDGQVRTLFLFKE